MPLVFKEKVLEHSIIAVWKITEPEAFFLKRRNLEWDFTELEKLKGGRRMEWIASRYLLQKITTATYSITKDKYGKPQLTPRDHQISISHSDGYVAAIVSKKDVGIDIQKKVQKITRIAHKYVNSQEEYFVRNRFSLSNLHLIWGAKESLFKAYGRKEVDYKKDLNILPFTYRKSGTFKGTISKKGYHYTFKFENKFFNNFYLVYGEKMD